MFRNGKLALAVLLWGVAVGSAPAMACEDCGGTKGKTYLGETAILGNGTAWSWVTLDAEGKPTAVGVTFTETALAGLPTDRPAGMSAWEYPLPLPKQAAITGFNQLVIDWNPLGHIPPGIYDVPHFDFHFYLISPEDRTRITAKGDDREKCRKAPPAAYLPEGYIYAPESEEPRMGSHWVHPASPELNGQPFASTFIYGFYDGKMAFQEPMVALAFLQSKPNITYPIKRPQRYPKKGFYPSEYSVKYDPVRKEYTVTLGGLVQQ